MKVGILAAMALLGGAVPLVSCFWNLVENGPPLKDPQAFFGCYGSEDNRLVLTAESATVTATHQSARIVRFFLLKSDAAIHTVNNLELDTNGRGLRIGSATTGFFYRFNNSSKPSALLVPDDSGNERTLARSPC